jgi:hypothetical protein
MVDTWDSLDNIIFKQADGGRIAGGRPVDASTYAPNFDVVDVAPVAIDKDTGGLLVHPVDLSKESDAVSIFEGAVAKRIDEASSTITYIGEAVVGSSELASVWRIRKIDFNNPIAIKWAGSGSFDQVWSNRTGLTYA